MEVQITGLRIYPVKGCGAIEQEVMLFEDRGPALDRCWMITRPDGTFLTQREHPSLARVRPSLLENHLRLSVEGGASLLVPLQTPPGAHIDVTVWSSTCSAVDLGEEAARFFQGLVGDEVRLVALPETESRPVDIDGDEGRISFADGFPLLVCHEASLEDLNARMELPLPMDRFRPNVVVRGGEPWDEDGWGSLRGDTLELRMAAPCERCKVTTVDQQTAEISKEPLATLATFRRLPTGGVVFGQNAIHHGAGPLRVGQVLRVES